MIRIIVGPPAAGKTSLIRERRADGDVVVDFDAIARALGATKEHEHSESVGATAFAARIAATARVFEGVDDDAWIIASSPSPDQIERWGEGGARFVLVDPGKNAVLEQAKADGRPEGTAGLIEAWYDNPPDIPAEWLEENEKRYRMLTKTHQVQLKAETTESGATTFSGYAAVFGNVDLGGDKIVKGAFAGTLAARYPNDGAGVPVYWNHNTDDPFANLGVTSKAVEDDHGLLVTATVDTSTEYGQQVAKLLKENRVTQMSFAFDVKEGAFVESKDEGYFYELRALDLFEVSVVPIGMNQATEIVSVKKLMEAKGHKQADVTDEQTESLAEKWAAVTSTLGAFERTAADAGLALSDTNPAGTDGQSGDTDLDERKAARRETAARRLRALNL